MIELKNDLVPLERGTRSFLLSQYSFDKKLFTSSLGKAIRHE